MSISKNTPKKNTPKKNTPKKNALEKISYWDKFNRIPYKLKIYLLFAMVGAIIGTYGAGLYFSDYIKYLRGNNINIPLRLAVDGSILYGNYKIGSVIGKYTDEMNKYFSKGVFGKNVDIPLVLAMNGSIMYGTYKIGSIGNSHLYHYLHTISKKYFPNGPKIF